jgi:hypothetical protein
VANEAELKRTLAPIFLRDIRSVEPDKKGFLCGDDLRIYDDGSGNYSLRFLKGTPEKTRKQYKDKLDGASITYKVGKDYTV